MEKTTTFTADWIKSRDPDTLEDTEDCLTWRAFRPHYDRYAFDTGHCHGVNWKQYDTDQDAWYFGVWVNLEERLVVTYAEGDITVRWIKTVDALRAELKRMAEFYGDPPPFAVSFGEEGRVEYYEERPKLED